MSHRNTKAIRPRAQSESDNSDRDPSPSVDGSENEAASDHGSQSSDDSGPEEEAIVSDITFGALAEAQAKYNPNPRKRKLVDTDERPEPKPDKPWEWRQDVEDARRQQEKHISRSSKHAPTIMSTRNPVSRKRAIFSPPPAEKFRDPRFDAAIVADARRGDFSSTNAANSKYAFLSEYQATEVLGLKAQLKKTKDPEGQAELKRQIMSIEAKLRNAETKRREDEILKEHKKQERQAIKEGKKARPYYLKESELKKRVLEERKAAMGAKARDKSDKRKKKREKTKESKDMPRVRRNVGL